MSNPTEEEIPPELLAYVVFDPADTHDPTPRSELLESPFTWDRYNGAATSEHTASLMEQLGWTRSFTTRAGVIHLERPGKDEGSTSATVGAVAEGVLYVHTSSDPLFDEATPYDAADVYAQLHHGGDRAAAERALQPSTPGSLKHRPPEERQQALDAFAAIGEAQAAAIEEVAQEHHIQSVIEKWADRSYTPSQLENLPPLEWVIDGLIPASEFVVLYGAPKAGKTFTLLDMSLRLSRGMDWHGKQTKPQNVLYLVGEGIFGYQNRERAWRALHGAPSDANVTFVNAAGMNLRDEETVKELSILIDHHKATLLVVDTINRLTAGMDENSPDGMGQFVNRMDHLRLWHEGLTILAAHHGGKEAKAGLRGHSSLLGAVGASILMRKTSDTQITLKLEDAREAEPGLTIPFDLIVPDGHSSPVPVKAAKKEADPTEPGERDVLNSIVNGVTDPHTIAQNRKMSPQKVRAALRTLEANRLITETAEGWVPGESP